MKLGTSRASQTHYRSVMSHAMHGSSPSKSRGFILQPTFLILRIFYRLLVFFIIVIGLSSYWVPMISGYKQAIEKEASSFLGTKVTIEDISYEHDDKELRWILKNVKLQDYDQPEQTADIDELSMTLDLAESLRTIRIQPDKIQASGVDVTVVHSDQGAFRVNGLKLPIAGFSSGAGRETPLAVEVEYGTLHWINSSTDKRLDLHDLSFNGDIAPKLITADIQVLPPESVGSPLNIRTELVPSYSEDGNDEKWSGIVNMQGEFHELSALPVNIQKFTGIIDGQLAFNMDASVKDNLPVELNGKLNVQNPILEQALHDTQELEDIYQSHLQSLIIDGHWAMGRTKNLDEWEATFALEIEQDDSKKLSNLSFDYQRTHNGFKLNSNVDQIDLDRYLPLLERQKWLNEQISRYLTHLKPRGQLEHFDLSMDVNLNNALDTDILGKGIAKNISVQAYENVPSLKKMNAQFYFTQNTGAVKVFSKNSHISYSKWFEKPIPINDLEAVIHWEKSPKKWDFSLQQFRVDNNDAQASGSGAFTLTDNKDPYIDINLGFSSKRKVTDLSPYLPSVIPKNGIKWITSSIKEFTTKGELLFRGNPKDFPFDKGKNGEFIAWMNVKDGKLQYLKDWPEAENISGKLTFLNEGLTADVASATVIGNKINSAHIEIPDFRGKSVLNITNIATSGNLNDQVTFLQASPLSKNINHFLKKSKFSGKSDLSVDIHTPIHRKGLKKENVEVNGAITLKTAEANFKSIGHRFKKIKGKVKFDQHGVNTKDLSAIYKKAPVKAVISTSKDKQKIILDLTQTNRIAHLLDGIANPLKPYVTGKTFYDAKLTLPSYSMKYPAKKKRLELSVNSDLKGVEIKMPYPVNKSAKIAKPFSINWSSDFTHKKSPDSLYKVSYDSFISALYRKGESTQVGVFINQEPNYTFGKGVNIQGSIHSTDLVDWKKFVLAKDIKAKPTIPLSVNLNVSDLLISKQSQGKSNIHIKHHAPSLIGNIKTERFSASLNKTASTWDAELVNLNIDSLRDKHAANPDKPMGLLPRHVPSLNLTCINCITKGQIFKKLALKTKTQGNTANINLLTITGEDYQLEATGKWYTAKDSRTSHTDLIVKQAKIDSPGDFLSRMGNNVGIRQAQTYITGDLNWHGSPLDFNLKTLSGKLRLNMQKGQLSEVKPGFGKLLGLLNFSKLAKRLRFDFSDVSGKGILFDRIYGDLYLYNGVLSTHNTIIESSIMLAGIKGDSDLVQKTHNQMITVIPDVKSALPAIGLIFGGVGIGAAVAALDKVTDQSKSKQLEDESVGTRYQVTGSWKEPQIKNVTPIDDPDDFYDDM